MRDVAGSVRHSKLRGHGCGHLAACGLAVALLTACSWRPYHIEVQQGNFLDQATVAKLQRGMTRDQVKFLLGSPLVADIFHPDRWDYVYFRQRANDRYVETRSLSLFFKDNALDRVEGDVVAGGTQARNQTGKP